MLIAGIALAGAGFIGGCQVRSGQPRPAPLIVPWSGAYATPVQAPAGIVSLAASPYAMQMLGDQDFFYGRAEKMAWGSAPLAEISAYTDYQYDLQAIGLPHGSGYRYRTVVRSAITVP